jgi:uncharacterized protein (TIGR03437 family)
VKKKFSLSKVNLSAKYLYILGRSINNRKEQVTLCSIRLKRTEIDREAREQFSSELFPRLFPCCESTHLPNHAVAIDGSNSVRVPMQLKIERSDNCSLRPSLRATSEIVLPNLDDQRSSQDWQVAQLLQLNRESMHKIIFRLLCGVTALGFLALAVSLSDKPLGMESKIVSAQTQPDIELKPVAIGLSSPLYLTSARDGSGRLFIVERPGVIRVMLPGATSPLTTPFLDIRAKVLLDAECGLLGLAFHPQYTSNRRFFVNYTRIPDGATVISEFTASTSNPNIAETNEKIILTIEQPFLNNNGGMIAFGPDGYLYIGMGDGGAGYDPGDRAQNIEELLGKMLRIDVDHPDGTVPYSSPSDNPYFGSTPGRDEIYAMGLRNPFRWSFDRATGEIYAGDAGEDTKEEIDIITRGGNYGWRVYEGNSCTGQGPAPCNPALFTPPIYEYDHTNGRCSVIGGYVYRGSQGTFLPGSYIFGDYCTGEIFMLNNNTVTLLMDTELQIVSFGEDEAGELYVVSMVDGSFYLFRISVPAPQPTVVTTSQASYFGSPLAVESLVCGFGNGLANTTQFSNEGQINLGGATVTVTDSLGIDRVALLNYVSPAQFNYHLPPGTALGDATITYNNTISGATFLSYVSIGNVNPGIFSVNGTGSGIASSLVLRKRPGLPDVYEPTYRIEGGQVIPIPIDLGPPTDYVILCYYGTGWRFRSSLSAVTVTIGETPCLVYFAGAHPHSGLDQTNVLLPRSLAGRGLVNVVMTADGLTSNTVQVSIR